MTSVASLHRYPVKSMQGESVDRVEVTSGGVSGDRAFALVDVETGQVASCHNPRTWGALLHCGAHWESDRVVITLPDGDAVTTDASGERRLSDLCERSVRFVQQAPDDARYELVVADVPDSWPATVVESLLGVPGTMDGRVARLRVGSDAPPGSLVDVAPVHLVTTSSLGALAGVGGDADQRRFRANVTLDNAEDEGFVEDGWTGRTLALGGVELAVLMPTMRCLVPTLEQRGVARHRDTLVALTRHNRVHHGPGRWACLGSYATVVSGGWVSVGDEVQWR